MGLCRNDCRASCQQVSTAVHNASCCGLRGSSVVSFTLRRPGDGDESQISTRAEQKGRQTSHSGLGPRCFQRAEGDRGTRARPARLASWGLLSSWQACWVLLEPNAWLDELYWPLGLQRKKGQSQVGLSCALGDLRILLVSAWLCPPRSDEAVQYTDP